MKHINKMMCGALLALATLFGANNAHAQVVVTATAGVMGPTIYPTLAAAVADINAGLPQGIIGVGIMSNITETGPVVINASGAGAAVYTAITISPVVDAVTISGPTPAGRGLIELNGADNVTINGDNQNTSGINRDLTIQNTAANTTTYTSVVRVALSTMITTGDNNSVRNCNLIGSATNRNIAGATSATGSEGSTYGILVGGGASTVSTTTAPSAITSNATVVASPITALNFIATNNSVISCGRGISIQGSSATVANPLTITNNIIGSAVSGQNTVYYRGIAVQGFTNCIISGNTLQNMESFIGNQMWGIGVGENSATGAGALIENNIIAGMVNRNTVTYGAYGVNLIGGNNHVVRNNFIHGINQDITGGFAFGTQYCVAGIRLGSGTGHQVDYNSINLYGARIGTPNSSLTSACIMVVNTAQSGCSIRNNVMANTQTGGTTSVVSVCLFLPSGGASAMNLNLNNNFYYDGTVAGVSGILQVGITYSAAALYTSANFIQAATAPATNSRSYTSTLSAAGTNDNASWASSAAAPFTSNTDLHINLAAPNVTDLDARAVVIAGITLDIDGNTRNAGTPDIGADEFASANCSAANGGTISPATQSICSGNTVSMTSTGFTSGVGITYQWKVATVSGGPYVNVSGGSGATTTSYTTAVLTAGVYYYVLQTTCSFGPLTGLSNELTVTVNANPTVVATPAVSAYCPGSAPIALAATGALGYTWSPAAGLSATTGPNVTATPSSLGVLGYIVAGVDANGCVGRDTVVINSAAAPGGVVASANDSSICAGGSVDLMSTSSPTEMRLSQNFNSGLGNWSVVNGPSSPAVSNWTGQATPYTLAAGSLNFTNFNTTNGGSFFMSNSDAGGSGTTTNTQLVSPVFTLAGMTTANLTFEHCYQRWASGDNTVAVQISTDGGLTWTNLQAYTADQGTTTANAQATTAATISLAPYVGMSNLRLRYNYVSTWGYFWILDDIRVTGNSNNTYAWTSNPVGFTSSTQNPTGVTPAMNTSYNVAVTNFLGCSSVDSVAIVVNALPAVTANVSADPSCVNDQVTFNGGGAVSYTWTGGVVDNTPFTNVSAGSFSYTVTGTDANGCSNTATISTTVNSLPVVALSGNDTICMGDTTVLTGTGGGTSQWYLNGVAIVGANSSTYNATAAGVYNMTKTNLNGCADSAATGISVVVNALPSVSASSTASAVCAGDSVTVNGAGAVSYAWTGGVNDGVAFAPMSTDTYTVTGTDANGCQDTATVAVTVNALPPVGANFSANPICAGDMVTLTGSGAVSYTWTGGVVDGMPFAPTMTMSYTVTGTDANGCMDSDSTTVTVNALPVVTASASDSVICSGDSVMVMGGGAVSYAWTGGAIDMMNFAPMSTDTYTVTGTDANGCTAAASVMITVNTTPSVTLSIPMDTACYFLGAVTMSGESPAGGVWSGPGMSGNVFDPGVAGMGMHGITYMYTDSATGCAASATDSVLVDICNDVADNSGLNIELYPNPNNGEFVIVPAGTGVVDVLIYNATGQLISAEKANGGQMNPINIASSGVYMITVITADGQRSVHRVVVNR